MGEALDMSLDDLIKRNHKPRPENNTVRAVRGRGSSRANNFSFGLPTNAGWIRQRPPVRATPHPLPPLPPLPLRLRMREAAPVSYGAVPDAETKLFVSNLDSGVTDRDIKILFSDVGEVKRCAIHCDCTGRSRGTANVTYARHLDALTAIRRFDNVNLDGKPIKIEPIGKTSAASLGIDHCYNGPKFTSGSLPERMSSPYRIPHHPNNIKDRLGPGGGMASGANRERRAKRPGDEQASGANRERRGKVSAEALDADLDNYINFG